MHASVLPTCPLGIVTYARLTRLGCHTRERGSRFPGSPLHAVRGTLKVYVMNHFGQHLRSGVQTSSNTTSLATTSCRSARHRSRKAHAFRPSAADVTDGSSQEQQTVQWRDARLLENLERLYHLSPLHSLSYAGSTQQHDIADPLWSHGVFSVSLDDKPPETKKGSQEKCSDYYANVGDAIRTLRDDIPHLFDRKLNCELLCVRCASPGLIQLGILPQQ